MNNFEKELFTTVDTILGLLGQQPKYTRDSADYQTAVPFPVKQERTSKPKGPRLVKTASELERVLENM